MLYALLSPAKKLDFGPAPRAVAATAPALLPAAAALAKRVKKYSARDLKRLMELSDNLAKLNVARFQAFDLKNGGTTKPALYAFAGDVYVGLDAKTLSEDDVAYAQAHIGILSGLYGLLRPLDAIQPYRLEMGTGVDTERGEDLYAYWRGELTAHLNTVLAKMKNPTVVNLASEEYFSAIDVRALRAPVVQCVFKEIKGSKAQVVSFLAKKARGMMARYIVQQRVETPVGLKKFAVAGYAFDAKASNDAVYVFARRAA
jgi:cytoplasmic iron level regulating protein YaaA (DUF328/UPF0246 family)